MQDSDAKLCSKGMRTTGSKWAKGKTKQTLNTEDWKKSVSWCAPLQIRPVQLDSHFPLSGKALQTEKMASSALARKQVWLTLWKELNFPSPSLFKGQRFVCKITWVFPRGQRLVFYLFAVSNAGLLSYFAVVLHYLIKSHGNWPMPLLDRDYFLTLHLANRITFHWERRGIKSTTRNYFTAWRKGNCQPSQWFVIFFNTLDEHCCLCHRALVCIYQAAFQSF